MRNLRIGSIILLMLLNINQGLFAKEGDELIGKPAPEWGKLKWMNSQPLQLNALADKVGSHPLVDGYMLIL